MYLFSFNHVNKNILSGRFPRVKSVKNTNAFFDRNFKIVKKKIWYKIPQASKNKFQTDIHRITKLSTASVCHNYINTKKKLQQQL